MAASEKSFELFINKRDSDFMEFISQKFSLLRHEHEKLIDKITKLHAENSQNEIREQHNIITKAMKYDLNECESQILQRLKIDRAKTESYCVNDRKRSSKEIKEIEQKNDEGPPKKKQKTDNNASQQTHQHQNQKKPQNTASNSINILDPTLSRTHPTLYNWTEGMRQAGYSNEQIQIYFRQQMDQQRQMDQERRQSEANDNDEQSQDSQPTNDDQLQKDRFEMARDIVNAYSGRVTLQQVLDMDLKRVKSLHAEIIERLEANGQ